VYVSGQVAVVYGVHYLIEGVSAFAPFEAATTVGIGNVVYEKVSAEFTTSVAGVPVAAAQFRF